MTTESRRASAQASSHARARSKSPSLLASTALIPVAAAFALMPTQAFAQDAVWDGETSTDWATATNWNNNVVPGPGNSVIINNGALPNQPAVNTNQVAAQTNILNGSLTINANLTSLVSTSGLGVLRISPGGQNIGAVSIDGTGTSSNNGVINGTLTINGGTFNNAGLVFGATTVNGGTLNLNTGSNLSGSASLTINGGTVNLNLYETVGPLAGTGGTLNFGTGGRLDATQSVNTTFAGNITGNLAFNASSFVKYGTGTLTLSGTNTTTGAGRFEVIEGTVNLQGGNAVGDQNIVGLSFGTLRLLDNETIGVLVGADTSTVDINGRTLTIGGIGINIGTTDRSQITGGGVLRYAAPGLGTSFLGAHTFTGTYQVSGGTMSLGGTIDAAASLLVDGGTLSLLEDQEFAGVTLSSGTIAGASKLTSATTFDVRSGSIGSNLAGSVGLAKTTAGTVTLSGANTYMGQTSVSAGTLRITSASALGSTAAGTTVSSGATLLIVGSSPTLTIGEALRISGTGMSGGGALRIEPNTNPGFQGVNLTGGVTLTGNATITNTDRMLLAFTGADIALGNSTLTFNSEGSGNSTTRVNTAVTGTGGITKTGSGLLELNGDNSFTGPLAINGGIVSVSGGVALHDDVAVTVASGARFDLVSSEFIGSLAGAGSVNIGNGNVLDTGGNNTSTTFSGTIFGAGGSLSKSGTGTFTLTGNNTYSGTTTINGGTLQIGDGGTTGTLGSGNVANNAALAFDRAGTVTIGNVISGTGSLTKLGVGTLVLTAANSYAGGTVIAGGTVVGEDAAALGTGAVRFTGNGALYTGNANSLTVGGVRLDANIEGTLAAAAGQTLTVSGLLSVPAFGTPTTLRLGTAGLTGTVRLDLNNTLAATSLRTIVQHGTLTMSGQGANVLVNAFGGLDLQAGATLDLEGRSGGATNLEGAGTVTNSGASLALFTTRLSGSSTFSGVIQDGAAATRFQVGRDLSRAGTILTLTGNNTYSGTTSFISVGAANPTSAILQIGDGGTTGSLGTGDIQIERGYLRFNRSDAVVLANAFTAGSDLVNVGTL